MLEETEKLIIQGLETVRGNTEHQFNIKDRVALYRSFGESRITNISGNNKIPDSLSLTEAELPSEKRTYADNVIGWLAIITAQHVVQSSIWEKAKKTVEDWKLTDTPSPLEVIDLGVKLLRDKVNASEVLERLNTDIYYGFNTAMEMTYDVTCAYATTVSTLYTLLYGPPVPEKYEKYKNESDDMFRDADISPIWGDFASEAVKAYSCIDNSRPTVWRIHKDMTFDANKRLEFWEWWMTEAIPQAWELAQ